MKDDAWNLIIVNGIRFNFITPFFADLNPPSKRRLANKSNEFKNDALKINYNERLFTYLFGRPWELYYIFKIREKKLSPLSYNSRSTISMQQKLLYFVSLCEYDYNEYIQSDDHQLCGELMEVRKGKQWPRKYDLDDNTIPWRNFFFSFSGCWVKYRRTGAMENGNVLK